MEESFSVEEIFKIVKKRFLIILYSICAALLLCALITFIIMTPTYEASTQILVNQSNSGEEPITSQELESNREFINTYSVIMTSPVILDDVNEDLGTGMSIEEIRNKISVEAENESQVANITVSDDDPREAVNLVNILTETFEEQVPNIMDVDNVSILSQAQYDESNSPVSPNPILNFTLAIIAGLGVGVSLAFLLEFLDKTLKNEEDIERELSIPILGTVPIMSNQDLKNINNKKQENENFETNLRKSKHNGRKTS